MSNKEVLDRLYNKIVAASGLTHEQFQARHRARTRVMSAILKAQAESQKMTDEILNKRCTI
ncbi:hypothetical protein D3C87_1372050 [compost metagenome]